MATLLLDDLLLGSVTNGISHHSGGICAQVLLGATASSLRKGAFMHKHCLEPDKDASSCWCCLSEAS